MAGSGSSSHDQTFTGNTTVVPSFRNDVDVAVIGAQEPGLLGKGPSGSGGRPPAAGTAHRQQMVFAGEAVLFEPHGALHAAQQSGVVAAGNALSALKVL